MIKMNKKSILIYVLLFTVLLVSIVPWFQEGAPTTDDWRHHASRIFLLGEQVKSFDFHEWIPNMYGGWPFFHFYHPVFYIFAAAIAGMVEPILALKILTCLVYAICLFATFFGVKYLFKKDSIAFVTAIGYFLSNHFFFHATVSGALPRLLAIALVPLTLCLFIKAIQDNSYKLKIISGSLLGILLMTHTSVAVPVAIICGIFALFKIKEFKSNWWIFAIALGIMACWAGPMLLEKDSGNFPSGSNTVEAPLIEQSFRTFGISHDGEHYIRSNYFSFIMFALGVLGFFLLKNNTLLKVGAIFSILLYFNLFGVLNLPVLATALTNTSTYFISCVVFFIVLLAALFIDWLCVVLKGSTYVFSILIALIVVIELFPATTAFTYGWNNGPTENFINPPELVDAWKWISEQPGDFAVFSLVGQAAEIYHGKQEFGWEWVGCPQCVNKKAYAFRNLMAQNLMQSGAGTDSFAIYQVKYFVGPCGIPFELETAYSNKVMCVYENSFLNPYVNSEANITDVVKTPTLISFHSESNANDAYVLNTNYFKPHWHAYANGNEIDVSEGENGLMYFMLPPGSYDIEVKYKTNITHIICWLITLMTLFICFIMWGKNE
jgi:hypothetical protein